MQKEQVKYFAFFNAEEAQELIGKEVEFSVIPGEWQRGILKGIRKREELKTAIEFPFISSTDCWRFIRTIPQKPDHTVIDKYTESMQKVIDFILAEKARLIKEMETNQL